MPLSAGHRSGNIGHRPPDVSGLIVGGGPLQMQMSRCLRRFWSLLVGQAASTLWVVSALLLHVKGLALVQVPHPGLLGA